MKSVSRSHPALEARTRQCLRHLRQLGIPTAKGATHREVMPISWTTSHSVTLSTVSLPRPCQAIASNILKFPRQTTLIASLRKRSKHTPPPPSARILNTLPFLAITPSPNLFTSHSTRLPQLNPFTPITRLQAFASPHPAQHQAITMIWMIATRWGS